MSLLNESGTIGQIFIGAINNVAGDVITALLMVFLILLVIAVKFGIPLEFIAVLLIAFAIPVAAYYGGVFLSIVVVFIIGLAWFMARAWLAH